MIRGGAVVLHVGDVARAVRFYIETLGMKLVAERDGESVIDAGEGFLLALRAGTERMHGIELHTKVPLAQAKSIFEMRGVTFAGDDFTDEDGNRFRLVGA